MGIKFASFQLISLQYDVIDRAYYRGSPLAVCWAGSDSVACRAVSVITWFAPQPKESDSRRASHSRIFIWQHAFHREWGKNFKSCVLTRSCAADDASRMNMLRFILDCLRPARARAAAATRYTNARGVIFTHQSSCMPLKCHLTDILQKSSSPFTSGLFMHWSNAIIFACTVEVWCIILTSSDTWVA